jgi:hypothetical protein
MQDVQLAKARQTRARQTREGLDTVDYILAAVGQKLISGRVTTLDAAKAELRRIYT